MSDQFFTVSQLNTLIRDVITSGIPGAVWVCGEIQGLRVDQKGHTYFELCENEDDSHTVKAKIRASIWSSRRLFIDAVLKRTENAFTLKDDIKVKFLCKVDFWAKGGSLSLTVENIDPTYTLGKIAQERQKLIAHLQKNGILNQNKLLEFPLVALNIGLVTSIESAAFNDFVHELKLSGFGFTIFVANATMQGKNSEASVVTAIRTLNTIADLDVIVITRGGGSIAELSCFDSEAIALAIAESARPVVTGIGHEINTTVTDLAAHTFAKTPTAVAQFLAGRVRDFLNDLDEKKDTIFDFFENKIQGEKNALRQRAVSLQTTTMTFLQDHRENILRLAESVKRLPALVLKDATKGLAVRNEELHKTIQLNLGNATAKINHFEKFVHLASPQQTLKRGFSITRAKNGGVIKNVRQVKKGDQVVTVLSDGQLVSEIL